MRNAAAPIALVLAALVPVPVGAAERPSFYETPRALGMGGAFTAVADDEGALFYNPAGLDRVRSWGMGIVNPLVEFNEKGYDFARDAGDVDFDSTAEVEELLRAYTGEHLHARAALFPYYVRRHLGIGVLGQGTFDAEVRNVAYPEIDVDAFGSVSGHVGLGYGFFDNVLRVGGAVKYVAASRVSQVYTAADLAADDFDERVKDDAKEGSGVGFDAGAMVTLPVPLSPTVAVAVLDIGDTDLDEAGEIPMQVNVGLSATGRVWILTLTGAADWMDVTANTGTDDDVGKRLHLGLEMRFPKVLALRGGLYQGYGTFGATLTLGPLKVEYATYAEELGSAAGDRGDRRHTAQVSLGW